MRIELLALNFQLSPELTSGADLNQGLAEDSQAAPSVNAALPEWLPLIPAGRFAGRDGRSWVNDQPDTVIAYNRALERDIVVDFEHATVEKAPKGEPAPASGWVPVAELEIRDGAVWGRFDWNQSGRDALSRRDYRYYSPAFHHNKDGRVIGIHHIALTNRHNLFDLPALNKQTPDQLLEEKPMALTAALAAALLLPTTATDAEAVAAIDNIKNERTMALNSQQSPSLNDFVPRTDYDALKVEADKAQLALNSERTERRNSEAADLVDAAIADGKITPANRDFYLATCSQENGAAQFKQFVERQPALQTDTNLDNKKPSADNAQLSDVELAVCKQLGQTEEEFLAARGED